MTTGISKLWCKVFLIVLQAAVHPEWLIVCWNENLYAGVPTACVLETYMLVSKLLVYSVSY